jgi:FtsH-binding integral membrane protein
LVIVTVVALLVHGLERQEGDEANPSKKHFWFVNVLQFFTGGLLSTFLVASFRSSSLSVSWPFLLVLAILFVVNELAKRNWVRATAQVGVLFLAYFTFATFVLPLLLHRVDQGVFVLAGVAALGVVGLFLLGLRLVSPRAFRQSRLALLLTVLGVYIAMNGLYFLNVIPPIPLTVKSAGVYYSVSRTGGVYQLTGKPKDFPDYFRWYQEFYAVRGEPVYVFTSVFSPAQFTTNVVHEWQKQGPNGWQTVATIALQTVGGRDGGFRTYSLKRADLTEGKWRVQVKTADGKTIGTVRFAIRFADALPLVERYQN